MRIIALVLFLCALLTAQPPSSWDGWLAVSSFKVNGLPTAAAPFAGNGGIWMLHPRLADQTPLQVTNLPATLTGAGSSAARIGTNSIAWMPRSPSLPSGGLAVGEISPTGSQVQLHLVSLAGVAATTLPIVVGTAVGSGTTTPFGSIDQIVVLPDPAAANLKHRLLFAIRGVNGNGFSAASGTPLGFYTEYGVNLFPLQLTAVPAGAINALCVSPDQTTAYFAMINSPAAGQSRIYSVPLPTTLPPAVAAGPVLLATVPHYVLSLATRTNGTLIAGLLGPTGPSTQNFALVTVPAGAVSYISGGSYARNSVAVERFTGSIYASREFYGPNAMDVMHRPPTGAEVKLSGGPSGGWGVVSGCAVAENPSEFGPATSLGGAAAAFDVAWDIANSTPNTYLLPRAGAATFAVGVRGTGTFPTDGVGLVWLDFAIPPAPIVLGPPYTGLTFNVDPLTAFLQWPLTLSAATPTQLIPLPIPPATPLPSPVGAQVYLQAALYSPSLNTYWLTEGLRITVID